MNKSQGITLWGSGIIAVVAIGLWFVSVQEMYGTLRNVAFSAPDTPVTRYTPIDSGESQPERYPKISTTGRSRRMTHYS